MSPPEIILTSVVGLLAGVLGGLAGIGGSMIMLPCLHMIFGDPSPASHHEYMAAAMLVNVAVAIPAAWRHHGQGAVRAALLPVLLPITGIFIMAGVLLGNVMDGDTLALGLALFITAYGMVCIRTALKPAESGHEAPQVERLGRARLMACGAGTGLIGGLLGLGGGVVMVPMLQGLCRIQIRQAIATSSAVMCITAVIGAALKVWTLSKVGGAEGGVGVGVGGSVRTAFVLAAALSPTAVIGAMIGAGWTHSLPLRAVRALIGVFMLVAAIRLAMSGLTG